MSRRFANFADRLEGRATNDTPAGNPADDITPPKDNDAEPGEPDPQEQLDEGNSAMTTETPLAERDDYKAGLAAGTDAERARMTAVFASEHFAGREAHAAKLLGKGLSAEDTIDLLADMPKAQPVDQATANAAAEEAAREEMREQMNKNGNVDLGADEGGKEGKTGRAKADARWDKANAAAGRVKKEG